MKQPSLRLAQLTLALITLCIAVAMLSHFDVQQTVLLCLSLVFALTPFSLLTEVRSILSSISWRLWEAGITPKKVAALAAITRSVTIAELPKPSKTDTMKTLQVWAGRTHYTPSDAQSVELIGMALKTLSSGVNPSILTSKIRKHGQQRFDSISGPLDTVLQQVTEYWDHGHVRKISAADKKFFTSKVKKSQTEVAIALAYRVRGETTLTFLGLAMMKDSGYAARTAALKAEQHNTHQALGRAIRSSLAVKISQLTIVILSLFGLAIYHLAPGITFTQIILLDALLYAPIVALASDPLHRRMNHSWHQPLGFGALAGGIAYANYLLFFVRNNLSPFYIDPGLDLYKRATSIALLSLLFCGFAYLLFERASHHENFFTEHLHSNERLLFTTSISVAVFAMIVYTPGLQTIFNTAPLRISDWASAVVAAGFYCLLRLLQRYTGKHSRSAVIQLHREVRG